METTIKADKFSNDENMWTTKYQQPHGLNWEKLAEKTGEKHAKWYHSTLTYGWTWLDDHTCHCITFVSITCFWAQNSNGKKMTDCKSIGCILLFQVANPMECMWSNETK